MASKILQMIRHDMTLLIQTCLKHWKFHGKGWKMKAPRNNTLSSTSSHNTVFPFAPCCHLTVTTSVSFTRIYFEQVTLMNLSSHLFTAASWTCHRGLTFLDMIDNIFVCRCLSSITLVALQMYSSELYPCILLLKNIFKHYKAL